MADPVHPDPIRENPAGEVVPPIPPEHWLACYCPRHQPESEALRVRVEELTAALTALHDALIEEFGEDEYPTDKWAIAWSRARAVLKGQPDAG